MAVFDILASDITAAGQSDFVVPAPGPIDIAVNNVGANGLVMANAAGQSFFALGDNLKLLRLWCQFYFGFGQGGPAIAGAGNIGLVYFDTVTLAATLMTPFTVGTRSIVFPNICESVQLGGGEGLYSAMQKTGNRQQVRLFNIDMRASLINVPAALVGQRIPVQIYMAVEHTFPMQV